ncbi:hypothetical protein ACP26C_16700 [Franconibacter helveticus 513]|uniref:hypothetical protein n=1 Tax=Franconibacter helveticus TaxID=357240 RepID=UPI0004072704|nr:hypothetical protein [Franconibacter helveticus]
MSVYAVVEKGTVINLVVWDGESDWAPESGRAISADGTVDIGWKYDGGKFSAPDSSEAEKPE